MSQTAKSCREHAEECRALARTMRREDQRRDMQVIVDAWEEAAAAKDERDARGKKVGGGDGV